jgi:imidazolonepropionase-like amidohydrolase
MRKTNTLIILAATLLFTASATAQVTVLNHATVIDGTGSGQYALYGVTTVNSMQTDPDEVVQVREAQKRGELRGARVFTVKYRFGPDVRVVTPEQARSKVDEIIAEGADYIKLWVDGQFGKQTKLTPEFCIAVLEQARKHGKLTFAHIYDLSDAKMLVEQGLNGLAHNVRDREVDAEFIALLKRRNVTLIPTLTTSSCSPTATRRFGSTIRSSRSSCHRSVWRF